MRAAGSLAYDGEGTRKDCHEVYATSFASVYRVSGIPSTSSDRKRRVFEMPLWEAAWRHARRRIGASVPTSDG